MRVTDLTKQNAVLRNIANNSNRMQTLQENMSSGRRINRLSDDPIGATQAEDIKTQLSFFDVVRRGIENNFIWLDRTESELAHMGDLLRRAKTLTLAQANANADATTRRVTAREIQAITDGVLQAGNAKLGKLYIFSGSATFTRPLEPAPARQPALLKLDGQPLRLQLAEFEGHSPNSYIVRITQSGRLGEAKYTVTDDGGESWSEERLLSAEFEVFNERGKPSDGVVMKIREPETADPTAAVGYPEGLEFEFEPNPPLAYKGNTDRRMVTTAEGAQMPLNLNAAQIFFGVGREAESVDVFSLLFTLKKAMEENDPTVLESRLDDIDLASQQMLELRADVGAVRKEMEDRLSKMGDREFAKNRELSQIEDLDFPAAIMELNVAEVRNRAALETGARLIQPTLLNFLR